MPAGVRFKLHSIRSALMDISRFTKKSGKTYAMPDTKKCTSCKKEITRESTPRHLFYSGFCSEACKDKYVGQGGF